MSTRRRTSWALKVSEMGNGRRAGIIGTAVVGVVALVAVLVVGFRGRHIGRNSAALTMPMVGHIESEGPPAKAVRPL